MNENNLINHLKNKKVYVVSPHLDDAALSMGMLLYKLKAYGNSTIINVFTKAHSGPYTLSAKKFIKTAEYANADELFNQRSIEDQKVFSEVNAKVINLGLTDALFRKKPKKSFLGKYIPELDHIYPTYRLHVLKKIHPDDNALKELKIKLEKIIPPDAIVLSPFGIGNHADHALTHQVCTELFKNILYYIDFPYNIRLNNFGNPPVGYEKFELDIDLSVKSKLIHYYLSQIYGLFPQGIIPKHKEIFFLPEKIFHQKIPITTIIKKLPSNPTITIGIPAYNEEKNLVPLITTLLAQKLNGFIIKQIVVISDGSSDNTTKVVKKIQNSLIAVKKYNKREGKPARINHLMSSCSSDILVLIDADVQICNPSFISDLIDPMKKDGHVLLTSGISTPLPPKTFFENIIHTGILLWDKAKHSQGMSEMYLCEGQIRALRKELYKNLTFPMSSADDVYPYLVCESKGYGFASVDTAIVYFRLPRTLKDYISQMARYLESKSIQNASFGEKFIKKYYTVSFWTKLKIVIREITSNPLFVSLYLLLLIVPKFLSLFHSGDRRGTWEIIQTTKDFNS